MHLGEAEIAQWPWLAQAYQWPSLRGKRVLVVGIGGGSDILSAYAFRELLDVGPDGVALYANTKRRPEADWQWISPNIAMLPESTEPISLQGAHGSTAIDRIVPRDREGSPLIFHLPRGVEGKELAAEIRALDIEHIFAIDTGGDVLGIFRPKKRWRGRDRQMLRCLISLDLPLELVVIGLGSDGDMDPAFLEQTVQEQAQDGRYLGCFSLDPMIPLFAKWYQEGLPANRTPSLICQAASLSTPTMTLPRGQKTTIPCAWLTHGFAFSVDKELL